MSVISGNDCHTTDPLLKQLQHLKGRLKRDEELRIKYKAVIDDYVAKGYAKKMSNEEAAERSDVTWYLPHHPVLNPNKPGKVRVVFDAAAKFQGTSLNDQLVQGPDLILPKQVECELGSRKKHSNLRHMIYVELRIPELTCSNSYGSN